MRINFQSNFGAVENWIAGVSKRYRRGIVQNGKREAGAESVSSSNLPAPDHFVQPSRGVSAESPATPKGQIVDHVSSDLMRDVEFRIPLTSVQAQCVATHRLG